MKGSWNSHIMVNDDVRRVETEIDASIQKMAVWKVRKAVLLRRLMDIWRDGLEVAHLRFAHAAMFQVERGVETSLASEHLIAAGAYQTLKWALEYTEESGTSEFSKPLKAGPRGIADESCDL